MAGTYHLANLHDQSYTTWTIPTAKIDVDKIPANRPQKLTFEIWNQLREQVFDSMKYYPCLTGVSLEYVLNYTGAKYSKDEIEVIYELDEKGKRIQWPDKSYKHTIKVRQAKFNARMHKRDNGGKLPYSGGQHIALYTDEEALNPAKVKPEIPPRNMIFTFIDGKTNDCKAFMLGVHSDKNTKNDIRDEETGDTYDYDELYEGIYVDALCAAGSGGAGTNFFKILRKIYKTNLTLKATKDAISYYPTLELDPKFSFGTCEKKIKQNDSAEIVRLLSSLSVAERTPFFKDYNYLTQEQKRAIKLVLQHNLADDQNNASGRWKTRLNEQGNEVKAQCPFFVDEADAIDDKEAARLYRNGCLDNGVKMSSCQTKKKQLKITAYSESDADMLEQRVQNLAREARRHFGHSVTKKNVFARLQNKEKTDTMWHLFEKYNLINSPQKKSPKAKSHKKKKT